MINNDPKEVDLQIARMQRDSYQESNWRLQQDLDWHKDAVAQLRDKLVQIRFFVQSHNLLEGIDLTVNEAHLFDVCRVCKKPAGARPNDPFVLHYGDEYAHKSCLKEHKNGEKT